MKKLAGLIVMAVMCVAVGTASADRWHGSNGASPPSQRAQHGRNGGTYQGNVDGNAGWQRDAGSQWSDGSSQRGNDDSQRSDRDSQRSGDDSQGSQPDYRGDQSDRDYQRSDGRDDQGDQGGFARPRTRDHRVNHGRQSRRSRRDGGRRY